MLAAKNIAEGIRPKDPGGFLIVFSNNLFAL